MAHIVKLDSFNSETGDLKVFENLLPGEIKRVYFISGVPENAVRGKHRHHKTWQALICINGKCSVYFDDNITNQVFDLDESSKCLIIEPQDWHVMYNFSADCVLLVIANEYYDVKDYIDEPYTVLNYDLLTAVV